MERTASPPGGREDHPPGSRPPGESNPAAGRGKITALLMRHGHGDDRALADALAAVYGDLRRIAGRLLANERPTPTFDEESLVQEAYVRLVRHDRTRWSNRRHLFAIATRIMRRILVDRARARHVAKRGGGEARTTTFDGKELARTERGIEVLALDDALADLASHDESLAQLVELRFFGGLSNGEIAELQGVTSMTVIRRWRLARAWLERYLSRRGPA
ncbi:MAG: ECF-type sigma factor [Holophagales bacterium]|nr:ECF-type sigma factor [Holophagales bacterium]